MSPFAPRKQRGFRGAKGDNPADLDSPVLTTSCSSHSRSSEPHSRSSARSSRTTPAPCSSRRRPVRSSRRRACSSRKRTPGRCRSGNHNRRNHRQSRSHVRSRRRPVRSSRRRACSRSRKRTPGRCRSGSRNRSRKHHRKRPVRSSRGGRNSRPKRGPNGPGKLRSSREPDRRRARHRPPARSDHAAATARAALPHRRPGHRQHGQHRHDASKRSHRKTPDGFFQRLASAQHSLVTATGKPCPTNEGKANPDVAFSPNSPRRLFGTIAQLGSGTESCANDERLGKMLQFCHFRRGKDAARSDRRESAVVDRRGGG